MRDTFNPANLPVEGWTKEKQEALTEFSAKILNAVNPVVDCDHILGLAFEMNSEEGPAWIKVWQHESDPDTDPFEYLFLLDYCPCCGAKNTVYPWMKDVRRPKGRPRGVVSFAEAKKAKANGFSEKCEYTYYICNTTGHVKIEKSVNPSNWNDDTGVHSSRKGIRWSAPTYKQLGVELEEQY